MNEKIHIKERKYQGRDAHGRFRKGISGNPHGRPPGARNKLSLAGEDMLKGEAEGLTKRVVELARAGNVQCLLFCLKKLLPNPKISQMAAGEFFRPKISESRVISGQIFGSLR
jgi:hypothetical protein